ncbi:hypothetical protein FHU41_001984 [Psychromicrobium silvestre]|uniref:Uncharacterized protein n=1 Tax=Psychromicrobium silvestre TaxID=1645614 RepID=A0A7Y9S6Y1_9MICC|nr:hypothetical protein [Psychromicrobium silvestre]
MRTESRSDAEERPIIEELVNLGKIPEAPMVLRMEVFPHE